jgi:hypothetical protein
MLLLTEYPVMLLVIEILEIRKKLIFFKNLMVVNEREYHFKQATGPIFCGKYAPHSKQFKNTQHYENCKQIRS